VNVPTKYTQKLRQVFLQVFLPQVSLPRVFPPRAGVPPRATNAGLQSAAFNPIRRNVFPGRPKDLLPHRQRGGFVLLEAPGRFKSW
jgi:hypothetical protein